MSQSPSTPRKKKRAIALGGGGPAAGFLIGALAELEQAGIDFDVWALSCIGAWVGLVYQQHALPENRAQQTYDFFAQHAFRDTASYAAFPVNKAFAPDFNATALAWAAHALSPKTWFDVFNVGGELPAVAKHWVEFLADPAQWGRAADRNAHLLNDVLAVHPLSRFLTSMGYVAGTPGLSRVYYEDSTFLKGLAIPQLNLLGSDELGGMSRAALEALARQWQRGEIDRPGCQGPEIYHNAWRCQVGGAANASGSDGEIRLFNNKWACYARPGDPREPLPYLPISRASLCACSALPYVLQPVAVPNDDGAEYTEGALIDTVNFRNLVEDHPDLDEIWVCRIVDDEQVRRPQNLHDALSNLCEQFAGEVGENDVSLFRHHLRKVRGRVPRVVEIPLASPTGISFRWDRANLDQGVREGRAAVRRLLARDPSLASDETAASRWPSHSRCGRIARPPSPPARPDS